jgi:hypothetical protein
MENINYYISYSTMDITHFKSFPPHAEQPSIVELKYWHESGWMHKKYLCEVEVSYGGKSDDDVLLVCDSE